MKKAITIAMAVALMLTVPLGAAFAADVFMTKTELIQYNPDKAFDGYNLFMNDGTNWLMDMEGRIVHRWDPVDADEAPFGMYGFLMENGNLRQHVSPTYAPAGILSGGGGEGRIEEYNWDGERIWYMDLFDGEKDPQTGEYIMVEQTNPFTGATTRRRTNGTFLHHHDSQRMYNSAIGEWTYLVLVWVAKDQTDAENLGADPDLGGYKRGAGVQSWSPCAMMEILPDYESGVGGDIIWYWTFTDHMVTTNPGGTHIDTPWTDWSGRIAMPAKLVSTTDGDTDSIRANPQLLDVNGMHYTEPGGPTTDYQHCNSIDYNEDLGYIAINAKACNEFFVIDHDGTFDPDATPGTAANGYDTNDVGELARGNGGDFLYRYGNPGNYYSGKKAGFYDEGDMEMYGTHDIQWIFDHHWRKPMDSRDQWEDPAIYGDQYALPGAGHFMMFDNGCYNPKLAGSKILEVNPYLDGNGVENAGYVWMAPDGIYNTTGIQRRDQLVWSYPADGGFGYGMGTGGIVDFYAMHISSCSRMPNGNTVIDAGTYSHFFEVTEDREVVWEYVMPPFNGQLGQFMSTKTGGNMCFRMHRYAADHPALKGRDLTPGPTLTGLLPATLDSGSVGTVPVPPPSASDPLGVVEVTGGGSGGAGGGSGGGGGY